MRTATWLRSPSVRRRMLMAAALLGCFVWAMVIVGLSFAMVEHGGRQWWVLPLFGAFVLTMAVLAAYRVSAPPSRAGAASAELLLPVAAQGPAPVAVAVAVAVKRKLAEPLSPREMEVLHQLAAGRSNAEIAKALFIAPGTVKAHLNHIFRKLEAASRLQAVAHAREAGLLH